ncbi:hypothetical protein PUH89_05100 [Rhodobacter capsulatus]|uniref:hypothetical protein n=1 Tax=Rhodobacter capsulatus TaxID=1061 RepID=UPI001114190D|nr:hypothetical protein [Rhodobacter capsulatus]WER10365.1 hypothetical protein PUH89_05100 [Rhodobacter capsulatus]
MTNYSPRPEGGVEMSAKVVNLLKAIVRSHQESYGKLGNWSTWIIGLVVAAGFLGLAALFLQ